MFDNICYCIYYVNVYNKQSDNEKKKEALHFTTEIELLVFRNLMDEAAEENKEETDRIIRKY